MQIVKVATLIVAILGLVACDGEPITNIDQEAPLAKTLQAEAYSYVEGSVVLGDGGTTVQQFNDQEYLYYPAVNFDDVKRITVNYASEVDGGALEFRLGAPDGELIAFIDLPNTGGWQNFAQAYGGVVGDVAGQHSLYVIARNENQSKSDSRSEKVYSNVDYFTFSAESSPPQNIHRVIEENTAGFCYAGGYRLIDGDRQIAESTVVTDYEGAFGEGYIAQVDLSWLRVIWKVSAPEAGVYTLRFRYANGSDSSRPAILGLNNRLTQILNFETTSEWTDWQYLNVKVPLFAGENAIGLTSYVNDIFPHIDSLAIIGSDVVPEVCGVKEQYDLGGNLWGYINVTDNAPGWASMNGGTTGGGHDLFAPTTVFPNTMSELQSAASGTEPRIIDLLFLDYSGTLRLRIGSNKTIISDGGVSTVTGNIEIVGSSNVVLRGFSVRGNPCDSAEECKDSPPVIYVGDGATNIWLDHLDIADGKNGNLKVTNKADFVTVSWNKFHYTSNKQRPLAEPLADGDSEAQPPLKSRVTYVNNWWGPGTERDLPHGSYSNIHMLNNYFNTGSTQVHAAGTETALIAENNYYEEPSHNLFSDLGGVAGWLGSGNEGSAQNMNDEKGSTFYIPYTYMARPASSVKFTLTATECGAGHKCVLTPL